MVGDRSSRRFRLGSVEPDRSGEGPCDCPPASGVAAGCCYGRHPEQPVPLLQRSSLKMKRSIMSRAIPGIPLLAGGSGLMAGALLPRMTLLAGLHPLRGIIGLNGKIVFAVGAVAFIAGLLLVMRPVRSSVLMTSV